MAGIKNRFIKNGSFFWGSLFLAWYSAALYSELLKKDYYKSSMVLSCDYLNTQILKNTIEKFNLLAEKGIPRVFRKFLIWIQPPQEYSEI